MSDMYVISQMNEELTEEDIGGKGLNLLKLKKYGFKVPFTVILSTKSYVDFLDFNNLIPSVNELSKFLRKEPSESKLIYEKTHHVRASIMHGEFPQHMLSELEISLHTQLKQKTPLAVRSSASLEDSKRTSFAGIHDSFLNVVGLEQLLDSIKGCYASLWTDRAVSYRSKMGLLGNRIEQAVLIMELVNAKSSGVAFTCDPLTGRADTIIINANYGLGEAIVSGLIEPDEYKVNNRFLIPQIIEKQLGKKEKETVIKKEGGVELVSSQEKGQVLEDLLIIRLTLLIQRVYDALGKSEQHQDVEWVFDGEEFFLVQARPATHLPKYTYPILKNQPEIWSNANMKDAMPMVQTIFGWMFLKRFSEAILGAPIKITGYKALEGLEYSKLFQGRSYFNLSLIQWEFFDALGVSPKETNETLGGHQPEIQVSPPSIRERLHRVKRLIKLVKEMFKAGKQANQAFERVTAFTQNFINRDLTNLTNDQLIDEWKSILMEVSIYSKPIALVTNAASFSFNNLVKQLNKDFSNKGVAIANRLMMGKGKITSAEQGYRLLSLAEIAEKDDEAIVFFQAKVYEPVSWKSAFSNNSRFKKAFEDYLQEFGHRGVYEGDISNPRWREDPTYLFSFIESILSQNELFKWKENQRTTAEQSWKEIMSNIPLYRRSVIKRLVKTAVVNAEKREMAKSQLVRLAEPSRMIAKEIGKRFVQKGILTQINDIFHCSWIEVVTILLGESDGMELDLIVRERKQAWEKQQIITPPDIIQVGVSKQTNSIAKAPASTHFLTGLGVASGRMEGKVRVITHPSEGSSLQVGEILVAPTTDPAWTPLFLKASGIIMETGGYLSHGAIVSREYGIPAVVNIPSITSILKNGDLVVVDGDEGKVYLTPST